MILNIEASKSFSSITSKPAFLMLSTVLLLISGILILLSSVLFYSKPKDHIAWGIVIIIFSALSLFGMGGFVLGALLGLAGGILAIVWEISK